MTAIANLHFGPIYVMSIDRFRHHQVADYVAVSHDLTHSSQTTRSIKTTEETDTVISHLTFMPTEQANYIGTNVSTSNSRCSRRIEWWGNLHNVTTLQIYSR